MPSHASATVDFCREIASRHVQAPASTQIFPHAIVRSDNDGGHIDRPERLLTPGLGSTTIERTAGSDPSLVIDFGYNVSGRLTISTTMGTGASVHVSVSESLQFLSRNSDIEWGEQGTQTWIPASGPDRFVSSQLTMRYAMVYLGGVGTVAIDRMQIELTSFHGSPDTFTGCFESSDDLLNRIWYSGAYTVNLNTVGISNGRTMIFDGAKRDRAVWTGDLAVQARVSYLTNGNADAVRDSLADMANRQRHDGSIPPSSFMDYGLILYDYYAWWVVAFAEYYAYSGDREFAEEYYGHMVRQVEWFTSRTGSRGLVVKDAGIEWAMSLGRNGEITYLNAVYVKALVEAARLADALERPEDAARWRERANTVTSAMNAWLFDEGRGVYVTSDQDRDHIPQDGNALAVLHDIAPPSTHDRILDYLREHMWTPYGSTTVDRAYGHNLIHDKRIWPFSGYFELEARFATGDDEGALDLLRRQWGHMHTSGPGTMWEWMQADGSIESGFASLAHGWSAGATASLSERVLGVRWVDPTYARFEVTPHPGDLSWARGRVGTPHGDIDVTWSRSETTFSLTVTVPDGTRGSVRIPLPLPQAMVSLDGTDVWRDGTPLVARAHGDQHFVEVELLPGTYHLEATSDHESFAETGFAIQGTFKQYWDRSGGLPVFGYPLSEQSRGDGRTVQYFERQRFEYHPEHVGTPYVILLGLLGSVEADARGLRGTAAFQPSPSGMVDANCDYFSETGHMVCGAFRAYWRGHGLEFGDSGVTFRESLALFGFPISGEFVDPDTGLITQYFERARFEHHPWNPDPYHVLLGRLGASVHGFD